LNPNVNANLLTGLFTERHSCRAFLPASVPRQTIARVLDMAQRTASWCNTQPWQVIVTSGAATERFRAGLLAHAARHPPSPDIPFPREYRGVYLERRRACGWQLFESVGIARGDREASARQGMENYLLFGAPHVAIVTTDEAQGSYGAIDCGAYVSNFMLSAWSLGIASIAQAAIAGQAPFVREHFKLAPDRQVLCGISFGFEDAEHPANKYRTARASLNEAVRWVED
jgi:nitroreductase